MWDAVSRSLLRLGKAGATEAHARSLCELLRAHKLVKVQVNGPPGVAAAAAATLVGGSGGALLQLKGGTLLFGDGSCSPDVLLEAARDSSGKTAAWRERRNEERGKRQQALAETAAKRAANASRGSRKIGRLIANVSGGGGGGAVTREGLRGEWQQLAAGITAEVAGEPQAAPAGGPEPKQPWKRAGGKQQQQQR